MMPSSSSSLNPKTVPPRGQRRSLRRAAMGEQRSETLISPTATAIARRLNSRRGQKERRCRLARSAARPSVQERTTTMLVRRREAH